MNPYTSTVVPESWDKAPKTSLLKERSPKTYWETVSFLENVLIPSSWHKTCKAQLKIKLHSVVKPQCSKEISSLHWEFSPTQKHSIPEITPRTGPCLLFTSSERAHVSYVGNQRIPGSLTLTEQEGKASDWAGSVLSPVLCVVMEASLHTQSWKDLESTQEQTAGVRCNLFCSASSNLVSDGLEMALAWEGEGGARPPVQTLT